MKEGVKDFKGKTRWSLLPWKALEGCVKILMYGARTKYSPNNWKRVKQQGTYVDAIERHFVEYISGEEFDPESGESHLSAIMCNLLFLEYNRMHRDRTIPFGDYIEELLLYDDYQKDRTQKDIDEMFKRME
jgi:hypothetical protein